METAPIPRGIIDTPILLDYRVGEPNAIAFITGIRVAGNAEFSEVSAMALVANCADPTELAGLYWFFYAAHSYRITAHISERAFRILERLTPPCGLTADDAIIASTAIEQSLPLYTLNSTRFAAVPRLTVLQPY